VVQTYIDKPYLIGGLKFDLRVYVLLAGCDPLKIYLYEEGLARFATEDYHKPKKSNLKHAYMHLTNYAINKLNPKFVFNNSSNDMDVGHKRSMTSVFKSMQEAGVDIKLVKEKISKAIVKTIITGRPLLAYMYRLSQPMNYSNDMCFQILGFDILIDENAEPYLLEVNHTPSFTADTPLDKTIKKNLLVDTLVLMNITKENKCARVAQILESN
jgi:tubulin polyglutamylase TTLL6/13